MEQKLKDLVQALPSLSPVDDQTQVVKKGVEARQEAVVSAMKYFMTPVVVKKGVEAQKEALTSAMKYFMAPGEVNIDNKANSTRWVDVSARARTQSEGLADKGFVSPPPPKINH